MTERGLVIARVGRQSLHQLWIDNANVRNWTLYISPYEELPPKLCQGCEVGEVIPGPKWSGLRTLLERWSGWRDYDYVWMPDDDILTDQATISRMFREARRLGFDLFAPALHEDSHFAHYFTMRNRNLSARAVGFVEIMVPCFSRAALEQLRHTLDLSTTGWGWGLDSVWPKLLGYEHVGIIDGITVHHTRPVGVMRDADLSRRVLEESDRLLEQYDCAQIHTTFGAFGPDGKPLDLTPERLLVELVKGAQYLFEEDPRVLLWLLDFQRGMSHAPPYPVAGTPEGGTRSSA